MEIILSMSGIKWDENKLRWDLLPWDAIEKIVEIYSFGAAKYGDNNWQGVESERYFAALMRHLVAREKGELYDKESGKLHSAHAAWNCIALLWNDLKEELNVGKGSGSKVRRESKKG